MVAVPKRWRIRVVRCPLRQKPLGVSLVVSGGKSLGEGFEGVLHEVVFLFDEELFYFDDAGVGKELFFELLEALAVALYRLLFPVWWWCGHRSAYRS